MRDSLESTLWVCLPACAAPRSEPHGCLPGGSQHQAVLRPVPRAKGPQAEHRRRCEAPAAASCCIHVVVLLLSCFHGTCPHTTCLPPRCARLTHSLSACCLPPALQVADMLSEGADKVRAAEVEFDFHPVTTWLGKPVTERVEGWLTEVRQCRGGGVVGATG